MLKQQIRTDVIKALKAQDKRKLTVLRALLSEIRNKEIDIQSELKNEDVLLLVKKQIKDLNKAKEMFAKGARADLVKQNEFEIKILKGYLS